MKLSDKKINMLILGDSHAAQYWRAFALRYANRNVMQANASGCRPVICGAGAERCREIVDYALGKLLDTGKVNLVILAARWQAEDAAMLGATIARIRQTHASVVVIGPTIEYDSSFPGLLARAVWSGDLDAVTQRRIDERVQMNNLMAKAASENSTPYIDVQGIICPNGKCILFANPHTPMQFDYGHLTFPASQLVVAKMPEM
ncbi:SGNH hydrolase domain-containing protein [Novosphingobium terrae]|uniref:SGNH hydrolase domain-containing protein n=1 Tax=Novosphingobium terrae TaxID=2726189 RepID=UPI00237AF81F|nr:SGNH hydrolase domain-containing protein [Novosphingobium terrae]